MESPPSRRGAASRTRDRLLDAAETLFAKKGFGAVTTRAILRAAGQRNESAFALPFWRTAGANRGPARAAPGPARCVSGRSSKSCSTERNPSSFKILSEFRCNPLPASSRAVMRAFSPTSRGSLIWCVPRKSLRRSLIVTFAPPNSRRGSVSEHLFWGPLFLCSCNASFGPALDPHGHGAVAPAPRSFSRASAAKAFLADLPRLMEALLQAPAEAL